MKNIISLIIILLTLGIAPEAQAPRRHNKSNRRNICSKMHEWSKYFSTNMWPTTPTIEPECPENARLRRDREREIHRRCREDEAEFQAFLRKAATFKACPKATERQKAYEKCAAEQAAKTKTVFARELSLEEIASYEAFLRHTEMVILEHEALLDSILMP